MELMAEMGELELRAVRAEGEAVEKTVAWAGRTERQNAGRS